MQEEIVAEAISLMKFFLYGTKMPCAIFGPHRKEML